MKYTEYKGINYAEVAEEVRAFWESERIFERTISEREGQQSFTFFEGPPSANGTPGIHHVMARTVKDIFCRFKTQQGYQVKRKAGWDTHGLPVELQVEKELGITKEDIGKKISVEEYNKKCREAVMRFKDEWDDLTRKMGYWVDLSSPYITFEQGYIESVWNLLQRFYDKGLLYKGYTIQPYSPAAGTGLSSHELNQPGCYQDVKDTSITAQFKLTVADKQEHFADVDGDVYFLAWTTTPWTLPANSALAVGKNIDYLLIKTFNPYTYLPVNVIIAKELVGNYFNPKAKNVAVNDYKAGDKLIPYEVIGERKGSELVGLNYEQLLDYVPLDKPAFTVLSADFVSTEDGTGIVHLSKTFGADDYKACVENGVPGVMVRDEQGNEVPIVDKQGRFVKEISDFAGMPVKNYDGADESDPEYKSTDVLIAIKLKEENKAFKVEKYEHSYPHCWRTDKPILYYPLESWFIKTTAMKDRLVELNNTINWKPESTGKGRFGNWLENLVDWNLSRSRYWGTPLPIWVSEDGKELKCIGSINELKAEVQKAIAAGIEQNEIGDDFDLHRPFVDEVYLVSDSGQKMTRETDLIDVWFDSGAMPYAQWHYPFENGNEFQDNFPADFIAEGVDQTRGWFFTLHAIGTLLFDSVAFKNVIANGLVLDKNGNKMSKRLGNAVNPFETLAQYGPDATRWYMISNANPWDNLKFNLEGVAEVQRRFFGTLHNTYNFFALYANLDGFKYEEADLALSDRSESDRWILSKLQSVIQKTTAAYQDYEPTKAARLVQDFMIDDVSNWYVRLNRKRFWKGEYSTDKMAAYQTLYEVLETVSMLMAPISPFYADHLFRDLNKVSGKQGVDSVHLSNWPEVKVAYINVDLEQKMALAQNLSSLVHSLRKKDTIKTRQPLFRILIPVTDNKIKEYINAVEDLILSEVNVKRIEYIEDTAGILTKSIKPNFKKLGKQLGPKIKSFGKAVGEMSQEDIMQLENTGKFNLSLDSEPFEITLEDVLITSEDMPGWSVANANGITVALDVAITDDLRKEGIARDVVNRIQNLRKDMGLEVQDKVVVQIKDSDALISDALAVNKQYICAETQAQDLVVTATLDDAQVLDLDGTALEVKVTKVN
ncbi:MAG: isoleucine--tRNA ligase [Cyclobacteriaceae bacterium]|nr:isoleucine--tRNA ligase [Cyclobacteriaceae bacterium]MCH8515488.1 isoleucine--tRNA ligase [Cyclobacteriaceae bacterium]